VYGNSGSGFVQLQRIVKITPQTAPFSRAQNDEYPAPLIKTSIPNTSDVKTHQYPLRRGDLVKL
jgi:hypothetical protein